MLALTLSAVLFSSFVSTAVIPVDDLPGHKVQVQAHRGGAGLRPEETLFAFAYGMEVGAEVIEMDMVFTQDEIPVLWHDHYIMKEKCKDTTGNFVGKYIANITLAELKTLDCGSQQYPTFPQQELYPGATIATLEEVLDLFDCYGDPNVRINLETKLDPTHPNQTLPLDTYINSPRFLPYIKSRGYLDRVTIESFDWRTLVGIKKNWGDEVTTVALTNDQNILPAEGVYPWLGGVDLSEFNGSWVAGAHSIGASVISPIFGTPGTVNDPKHVHYVTQATVDEAHSLGMQILPWTPDDESSISYLLDVGVDGMISNYPERVMWVAHQRGVTAGKERVPPRPDCLRRAAMPQGMTPSTSSKRFLKDTN